MTAYLSHAIFPYPENSWQGICETRYLITKQSITGLWFTESNRNAALWHTHLLKGCIFAAKYNSHRIVCLWNTVCMFCFRCCIVLFFFANAPFVCHMTALPNQTCLILFDSDVWSTTGSKTAFAFYSGMKIFPHDTSFINLYQKLFEI